MPFCSTVRGLTCNELPCRFAAQAYLPIVLGTSAAEHCEGGLTALAHKLTFLGTLLVKHSGASQVTVMDQDPLALQCALLGARLNGIQSPSAASLSQSPSEASDIAAFEAQHTVAGYPAVLCQPFDWNLPYAGDAFDLIIAADVLYEETAAQPLAAVLPTMLRPGGKLLLADPLNRAPAHRKKFLEDLGERDSSMIAEFTKCVEVEGSSIQLTLVCKRLAGDTVGIRLSELP